ncbi:MAG: hypothetical protein AAFQ40_14805 [Cyanobacteria bacterium J06623_5]
MTTYRTDKTSRVLLSLFVAYTAAYGFVRNRTLRAVGSYESGQQRLYITKDKHTPGEGWEYKIFWPAIKLEETVRNLKHDL